MQKSRQRLGCVFSDPHLLVSVCQDGTVIVHTIRRGQFLRTLRPPGDSCVPAQISELQVGMEGHIVVQTSLEERSHRKVFEWWNVYARRNACSTCLCLYQNSVFSYRASTPFTFTQWMAACCLPSPQRSRWPLSTWCPNTSFLEPCRAASTYGIYTGKEAAACLQSFSCDVCVLPHWLWSVR